MLVMDRKAGDNKYLHRDFHNTTNNGIEYIASKYGEKGVKELVENYSDAYFIPLVKEVKEKGLLPIKDYLIKIYTDEESADAIDCTLTEKELNVKISYCPAVKFLVKTGHTPSEYFYMTTEVLYSQLAKNCGLTFKMGDYDYKTGKCDFAFIKE